MQMAADGPWYHKQVFYTPEWGHMCTGPNMQNVFTPHTSR